MDDQYENLGTAAVVAELTSRLAAPTAPIALPNGDTIIFHGNDLGKHIVPTINPDLPADVKAAETFATPLSLAQYVVMFKTATAILKASVSAFTVLAQLDYHEPVMNAEGKVFDAGCPGDKPVPQRNQHTATYKAELHPDFVKWRGKFGVLLGQVDYADFIEDMLHTIIAPEAADLLEALSDLKVHRSASFENKVDLRGGKIGLTFKEEDSQGGRLSLPDTIILGIPIFLGTAALQITLKLRYRLVDRALKLFVVCPGIDMIVRSEFERIAEEVREKTDTPLFYTA
jgi:hypothetical protein